MLTGQARNDIDKLWEKFWTGGITNPLTVIEQISYLLFARMLDMQEELAERKAARGANVALIFPPDAQGQILRWKNFKNLSGKALHTHIKDKVYPFFATLGEQPNDDFSAEEKTLDGLINIGEYMRDADLAIKNESVLVAAIAMIDKLELNKSDTKGDIYEYLLSKLTTAGINGQFRTPRHIIDCMVELIAPQPDETVCDPACGTAGFLARTMEYLNRIHTSDDGKITDDDGNTHYSGDLLEPYREHINRRMFWGFDFDNTMLRLSSMNMTLHGVSSAQIHYQDSLNKSVHQHFPQQEENYFDVILANPPFKGSLDESNINPPILALVKTKKTELLFVAHILRALKLGGRAAVIVPDGVLFGSSNAHQQLRKHLIESNQLEGVISLPSGVFKPYAGVSTAILLFTKGGTTERVWFYDVTADGYSLDDKRTASEANDLPTLITQWQRYQQLTQTNATAATLQQQFGDKTQAAFLVPVADIVANKYDLSINRYKAIIYTEAQYDSPKTILSKLKQLENDILTDLKALEEML